MEELKCPKCNNDGYTLSEYSDYNFACDKCNIKWNCKKLEINKT